MSRLAIAVALNLIYWLVVVEPHSYPGEILRPGFVLAVSLIDRLVVFTDAAATASNILGNESLFRLGLALGVLAVAFNIARTGLLYVLFRPVGRTVALITAFFGLVASDFACGLRR